MENTHNSWIWIEAQKILDNCKEKDTVIFETGYGPSGLPHIGTFQEVARTVMVMRAFKKLSTKKTRLIVFSDDMDALRKVPSNVPNQDMLKQYIGTTLTAVPNPFDTDHKSFAEYNNSKLKEFLNNYGFEYEFKSSTEEYKNGVLNETLKLIGANAEKIKEIVTANYGIQGGTRKETYCPFIPIDPISKKQIFDLEPDWYVENDILNYKVLGQTQQQQISILNGNVKCQWKVDWVLRWINYNVDYEMHGKDLIDSAKTGNEICNYLGKVAPITFMYELFLDEEGGKISKSKGNGLEFSDWIKYAPQESLQWFLFQNPRRPRKLFLGMIPQTVDMFIKELESEASEDNATWAIYQGKPVKAPSVSYQMLINLVSIANTEDAQIIWKYVLNYQPNLIWEEEVLLQDMIRGAICFYKDKIAPFKQYKEPTEQDKTILLDLAKILESNYLKLHSEGITGKEMAEALMQEVYEIGKKYFENDRDKLRDNYFKMLYQVLIGQETGPRFGHFAVAYGVPETIQLLKEKSI